MDALPPSSSSQPAIYAPGPAAVSTGAPAASPLYGAAPGDIYPRSAEERRLCGMASRPDWAYLAGLVALDAGGITVASLREINHASTAPLRFVGPVAVGVAWGATVGGAWLALPKCSPEWIGETPREGAVRASWPLALSLALLAGATAPIINAIVAGYDTTSPWSTLEREMHVVAAAASGFGGALLPYVLPPRTWSAARELDRLRFGTDGRGSWTIGWTATF